MKKSSLVLSALTIALVVFITMINTKVNASAFYSSLSNNSLFVSQSTTIQESLPDTNNSEDKEDVVKFLNAWARPAFKSSNTAVYLTIDNKTQQNIEIISVVASSIANKAEFHQTITDSRGIMSMSKIEHILIPSSTAFVMKPKGFHIMLMGLKKQLSIGESFELTFIMKDNTTKTVTVNVQST